MAEQNLLITILVCEQSKKIHINKRNIFTLEVKIRQANLAFDQSCAGLFKHFLKAHSKLSAFILLPKVEGQNSNCMRKYLGDPGLFCNKIYRPLLGAVLL